MENNLPLGFSFALAQNPEAINIIDVMTPVREAVKEDVKAGIRTCMAENRA